MLSNAQEFQNAPLGTSPRPEFYQQSNSGKNYGDLILIWWTNLRAGGAMDTEKVLRSWRSDLLEIDVIMNRKGRLARLQIKIGVPAAIGIAILAMIHVLPKLW